MTINPEKRHQVDWRPDPIKGLIYPLITDAIALCTYLHVRDIGCSGIVWINSDIYETLVKLKKHPLADFARG